MAITSDAKLKLALVGLGIGILLLSSSRCRRECRLISTGLLKYSVNSLFGQIFG